MIYKNIIRPVVFKITDAEKIHHVVINSMGFVSRRKALCNFLQKQIAVVDPRLHTKLGRLELANPVGLAAGFDKYIEAPLAYPMLGFGFAELGSITGEGQPGNPKPRLWRLPEDQGIIVYYGLSNYGSVKTAPLLTKFSRSIPYGVSIAPTTGLKISEMADDYLRSLLLLHPLADYITLNVSCPNVAAADEFSQISFIIELVQKVSAALKQNNIQKDIFIKIGPHHSEADLGKIVEACLQYDLTGIVATNLIKNRTVIQPHSPKSRLDHPGGISGAMLREHSNRVVRQIYKMSGGKLKTIGVGGIFTAEDAYQKIKCGASAVQIITGFIYGGPLIVREINQGLLKLLERDGLKSIGEAVGREA